jgi:phosphatidylglycerol:prolipoprotein diacylglycerol transferase
MRWDASGLLQHTAELPEAVLEGLILGCAIWLFSSRPRPRLEPAGLFLAGYGLIHFLLQFLPASDDTGGSIYFGWMTQGQMLSLPVALLGVIFLSHAYRSRTPTGNVKGPVALPN